MDAITRPWSNFNGGLTKPPLKLLSSLLSWRDYSYHYNDVIMSAMASQITSLTTVYSTVYSGAHQGKHQSSASLAFVMRIHRWPVNSPQKGPVTQKIFPFDQVTMIHADTTPVLYITHVSCGVIPNRWNIFRNSTCQKKSRYTKIQHRLAPA